MFSGFLLEFEFEDEDDADSFSVSRSIVMNGLARWERYFVSKNGVFHSKDGIC